MKHVAFAFLGLMTIAITSPAIASSRHVPIVTDSRIKTFVYNPSEVFRLVLHYGYQSNVEFATGEEVETISIGDAFTWQVTPSENRLFLKALDVGGRTNMTVITNRRSYQFDLISRDIEPETIDEELVYVVRFYYPEEDFDDPGRKKARPMAAPMIAPRNAPVGNDFPDFPISSLPGQAPVAGNNFPGFGASPTMPSPTSGVAPSLPTAIPAPTQMPGPGPSSFNTPMLPTSQAPVASGISFNYSIAGPSSFAPVKVFDDGRSTYFQFPNNNIYVPTITTLNAQDKEMPLNYMSQGKYIVVNRLASRFSLKRGQEQVVVYNESRTGSL